MKTTTISDAWEELFSKHQILEVIEQTGYYEIDANTIKQIKEPRLMTKFDSSGNLPKILRENRLGILPIENGKYFIARMNLYKKIETRSDKVQTFEFPNFLESLDPNNVYSESNALHVAFITGMIDEIAGEKVQLTISGRMRSGDINFDVSDSSEVIRKIPITVHGTQIEIDGGYEGKESVIIIEAKNKKCENFIIRQLYYPYRLWSTKVKKKVIPVFFEFDNGLYSFFTYQFMDDADYNSIKLIKTNTFRVKNENSESIKERILKNITLVDDLPQNVIPFPQADSFNRIIEMIYFINKKRVSSNEIAEYFQFTDRQGFYYISAASYLDLIMKSDKPGKYLLSPKAIQIPENQEKKGMHILFEQVLKHKVFYEAYQNSIKLEGDMPISKIIEIMKKHLPDLIGKEAVLSRRSQTVRAWVNWARGVVLE